MWIKICGITSVEDAQAAADAGADAVGLVFADSPRRVSAETARAISRALPETIEKFGVFVDASKDEILDVQRRAGLTGVQLHGGCSGFTPQELADGRTGKTRLRVVPVVCFDSDVDKFCARLRSLPDWAAAAVLIDTGVAGKQGGTGIAFDWRSARAVLMREAPRMRLIAAGGLNENNVAEAIRILEPWGVDVSSGVEASPGRKSPQRIAAFVRAARAAAARIELVETATPRVQPEAESEFV
jgi:phosphoribosylanthranilate isomerase